MRYLPEQTVVDVTRWERAGVPGGVRFTHPNPNDKKLWDVHGFWESNDHAADVLDWYGLELAADVTVPTRVTVTLTCSLCRNPREEALPEVTAAAVLVPGAPTFVPFAQFSFDEGMGVLPKGVVAVTVAADDGDAENEVEPTVVRFIAARELLLGCAVRGRALVAADPASTASYDVTLVNMLDAPQTVTASVRRHGKEVLATELADVTDATTIGENDRSVLPSVSGGSQYTVESDASAAAADEPASATAAATTASVVASKSSAGQSSSQQSASGPLVVTLQPRERRVVRLTVHSSERLAPYGHEDQLLVVTSASGASQTMRFVTVNHSDDYRTTLTKADIDGIKHKIATQDWAKAAYRQRYEQAERWQVPAVDPAADHLFQTRNSDEAYNCVLITLLSGERRFAEKSARFLREMIAPDGYFRTIKGGSQELVHEGEFFKFIAFTVDHMRGLDLLTDAEVARVHECFRTFMEIIRCEMMKGKLSNWQLCELQGCIECAAEMQDIEEMDYFMHCDGGILDHLSRGVLDDGWWYESAIGYNYLAMGTFLQLITTVDKWGFNLRDIQVPASYGRFSAYDDPMLPAADRIDGLTTEIWGKFEHNTRSVKQLVDSLTPFFSHDGVIFGMNDSSEDRAPAYQLMDPRYDLAYRIYREPSLLPLLATVPPEKRDLWYGVDELPAVDAAALSAFGRSVTSPVGGITMLRSQKPGRDLGEQYQVTVKTGVLGGAHGHYDRLALNSIRRFGKNFYNPENVWYSYHTFMYKFYVQNSVTHNMALVDLKQQDPTGAKTLQFRSDPDLQVVVQEIVTRWCNPPYGGWVVTSGADFAEQAWIEGRFVALPESGDAPKYASRSGYTEPITQRRATLVTDDYIVLVDYLSGSAEHQYDVLMHVNGLRSIVGEHGGALAYPCDDPADRDHFAYSTGGVASDGTIVDSVVAGVVSANAGEHGSDDGVAADTAAAGMTVDVTPDLMPDLTPDLTYRGVEPKLDPSPLSSGQFITDCHVFDARGTVKTSFDVDMSQFNGGKWMTNTRSNHNAPGIMHMDVWSVAPASRQIVVGCDPEYYQIQQKLHYAVFAGPVAGSFVKPASVAELSVAAAGASETVAAGASALVLADDAFTPDRYVGAQPLASGKFGAWIFGAGDVDVAVPEDAKSLTLQAVSDESFVAEENEHWPPVPSLFWGNGMVECADGMKVPIRSLLYTVENTVPVPADDLDYEGGPVKIDSKRMATSIPASPADAGAPAVVRVDLTADLVAAHGGAVRFMATVGADYPIGDERDRRRTLDIRAHGRTGSFVTVVEQHDGTPQVRSVRETPTADGRGGVIEVGLADGRTQRITVSDMTLANANITLSEE
ncbi:hypothetical protein [Bifidobacterium biavatii]|uniref:Uncharacterized protein n=1 Tax=Bifidobacterium biavatii DSM 23969 TaxID=1437608 RepID=A0A087A4S3_9BIFI|nr:hypothetical protein [Bifidobacterium biavatii]KFI53773.1 hypothetical protein BBIA_1370 [Bifidobacterium biavatii DSM 23969]